RGAPVLDATQDLDCPWAVEAVEDHVNQACPAAAAATWPLVPQLAKQPLDAGTGVRRNVRPPVDNLGDCRQRDARFGGDGRQRGPASRGNVPPVRAANRLSRHGTINPSRPSACGASILALLVAAGLPPAAVNVLACRSHGYTGYKPGF